MRRVLEKIEFSFWNGVFWCKIVGEIHQDGHCGINVGEGKVHAWATCIPASAHRIWTSVGNERHQEQRCGHVNPSTPVHPVATRPVGMNDVSFSMFIRDTVVLVVRISQSDLGSVPCYWSPNIVERLGVVVVGINPDFWSCMNVAGSSVWSSIGVHSINPPIFGDRVICVLRFLMCSISQC